MANVLIDAFRHNAWATATLIDFCKGLSNTELESLDTTGVYGSIIDTLRHFVTAEGFYQFLVSGEWPSWDWSPDETPGLDVLEARAKDSAAFWEQFLARGVDTEATVLHKGADGTERETKVGAILAQVLNHGNDHRSQISMLITQLGKEPPDLQAWSYARAAGRSVPRTQTPSES